MSFDPQPELSGDLLYLRPLREDDFDSLYKVGSDKLIWEQHPAWNRYKKNVFKKFFRRAMASGGAFAVIDKETNEIIGSSRYTMFNPEESSVEIGWTFLARKYWGGKYNGEMKRLMMRHAFGYVNKVVLLVGIHNKRSQMAVKKIGGKQQPGTTINGLGVQSYKYEISKKRAVSESLI